MKLEGTLNMLISCQMSEKDSLERAHKVQLLEMKTKLEKEHSQNVEQINIALQEKMQVRYLY